MWNNSGFSWLLAKRIQTSATNKDLQDNGAGGLADYIWWEYPSMEKFRVYLDTR